MIQFNSLKEALQYIPNCLLCKNRLDFSPSVVRQEWDKEGFCRTTLTFKQGHPSYLDTIEIDLDTESVNRIIKCTDIDPLITQVCVKPSNTGYYPNAGDMYLGQNIVCHHCNKYHYMIQIIVDLATLRIKDRILNSEYIVFAGDCGEYTIKNIYTTNKTEYTYFPLAPPAKTLALPLIPLDRERPQKTLKRIQNLLIFA